MNRRRFILLALGLGLTGGAQATAFLALDKATARKLVDPAAYRQPTVVALWSSDCVHCKKNFKLFSVLGRQDKTLRIVSVATEPESSELASHLAVLPDSSPRYAYGSDAAEALAFALDPEWRGELPRTLLFDGKGGRKAVSGVLDETMVRKALGLR